MKFTPAPWRILHEELNKPYIRIRGTRLGCRYKIANVNADDYTVRDAEESQANANLIVAAPDLYNALEDACLSVTAYGGQPPAQWLAALNLARGIK
jgi:hypothetical protein